MAEYDALRATAGASDANSYVTRADADDIALAHYHASDFTGASTANRDLSLMMATRLLDQLFIWAGNKTDVSTPQRLAWPRQAVVTPDLEDVASATIPQFLKEATTELALLIIQKNLTKEPTRGLLSVTAGSVDVKFDPSNPVRTIPRYIQNMLAPYGAYRPTANRLVRV